MGVAFPKIVPPPPRSPYDPENAAELLALWRRQDFVADGPEAQAVERLAREGLPTPRLEGWRAANLPRLVGGFCGAWSRVEIVHGFADKFVDKSGVPALSLPETENESFDAGDRLLLCAAAAFAREGLCVDIPAGESVDGPVDISLSAQGAGFCAPSLMLRLGAEASLTVVERCAGGPDTWMNAAMRIDLAPGAALRHIRIGPTAGAYTDTMAVTLGAGARYEQFALTDGAGFTRRRIGARLAGAGACCRLYALTRLARDGLADFAPDVVHAAPDCFSEQEARAVLDGHAHGVFQGRVAVHPGADGTDARQMARAILLSDGAEMDAQPELAIEADAVKCAHGATTGQLDADALFYLRSRGVPEDEACAVLIAGFVEELVDKFGDESVKPLVNQGGEARR